MASVTVYNSAKIDALIGDAVVGAVVNASGNLILTLKSGATINAGNVGVDHGALAGLSDDDHPQYAKTDGSRGAFATPTQGAKADAARPNKNGAVNINGGDSDGVVESILVTDDSTATGGWLNRLTFMFKASGIAARFTSYFNEYGEFRVAPAKENTVALRVFVKDLPNNPTAARSTTVPVFEVMDNRTDRNSLWSIMGDGSVYVKNTIKTAPVIVLSAAASVPTGTPAGTVIFRTTT